MILDKKAHSIDVKLIVLRLQANILDFFLQKSAVKGLKKRQYSDKMTYVTHYLVFFS